MKNKLIAVGLWFLLWFSIFAGSVWAQSSSVDAHRLYFLAITSSIKEPVDGPYETTPALESYLNTAGVTELEHQAAFNALVKFKIRYAALINAYNNSPSTLAGTNEETAFFLTQRDMLVQNTIELLQASLSKESFHLDRMVPRNAVYDKVEVSSGHRHAAMIMPVQSSMVPHYSSSRSDSVSVDGNGNYTLYETVVLDGYTNCSGCFGITHQGVVSNTLNGGQNVTGQKVDPNTYISLSNAQSIQFSGSCFDYQTPNSCSTDDPWTEQTWVNCSRAGTGLFGWGRYLFTVEAAITFSQVTGWINANTATLQEWCLLPYIPPDYNPGLLTHAASGAQYAVGGALCINSTLNSGIWTCTPGIAYSLTGVYTRKWCTHNNPPY